MSMQPDRRPDLALIARPHRPSSARRPQRRRFVRRQPRPRPGRTASTWRSIAPSWKATRTSSPTGRLGAPSFPMGRPALPQALRAAAERARSRRAPAVRAVPLRRSDVARRPDAGPRQRPPHPRRRPARDDDGPGRRAVVRRSQLHPPPPRRPPAVVARDGIASVQSHQPGRHGHDRPRGACKRILPAPTSSRTGSRRSPRSFASARAGVGLEVRFVVLCFGFLAPYRASSSSSRPPAACAPTSRSRVAGGEHPRIADGRSIGAELRERYGDVARFTRRVADGGVGAWLGTADLCVFPYPKPFASARARSRPCPRRPFLLSPPLARCAGAPSASTSPMTADPLARRIEQLADDPDALTSSASWSGVLAEGRRWSPFSPRRARLYEVLDVDRHTRRRVR